MQIGCTKRLLDYLGQAAVAANTEIDPLFSWSANFLTLNRRKAIAVVNDASRYGFILYGLTAKNRKELDTLILQGIRACLEVEHIDPALIDRYMADGGEKVSYTKTANRSFVARMNKFCMRAEWLAEDMSSEEVLQRKLLIRLNDDYLLTEKEHCTPYDLLGVRLASHYGTETPYLCRAGVFDVMLKLKTPCYRRLVIPMDCSFSQFHIALQKLFCWRNYHLHEFWLETYADGRPKEVLTGYPPEDEFEEGEPCPDDDVLLSDVFPERKKILYSYDCDDWIHEIEFVEIEEDYRYNYPQCLIAMGDAPPEDVGGPNGYADFLRVLDDPKDPEYEYTKQWSDGIRCEALDMERTNLRLKYCLRHIVLW